MSSQQQPHRRSRALLALAAAAALGLGACGGSSDVDDVLEPTPSATQTAETTESASPTPTITPATSLDEIVVVDGDVPEVEIPAPWAIDETRVEVLQEGGDQLVNENSTVVVNYAGYNARTGELFDSSWVRGSAAPLDLQKVVVGMREGLAGQSVGSRVLIAIPSEDGYAQGNPNAGIEVGDSLVFLVDIISANFEEATGEPVAPVEGLPVVTMTNDGPELAKPVGEPPSELVVQQLIKGSGPAVTEDAQIQVKYRAWVWATGEMWEDAWRPQQGPLDTLIAGWQEGLVGQPTGSRVMLIVPPALAYPDGVPDKDLEPGQTLVFVIDILDATNV